MSIEGNAKRFEAAISPHLNAAYNFAHWLTKDAHDAEDVVQEAFLRAYQSYHGYRGGNFRTWLLKIIRNTCYTWLEKNRPSRMYAGSDELFEDIPDVAAGPEATVLRKIDAQALRIAINNLPNEFREVIILRDLDELSYKEIAFVSDVPIGTVMSRIARARKRLAACLLSKEEVQS